MSGMSPTFPVPAALPRLMDQDLAIVRLRAMQRLALALLLAVAVAFVLARIYEPLHPGLGYLRAFCEAALVGGLADWFAVTALFRRPLGLPIPHTAIVPEQKDRLGEALGEFVERNFLSPEVVAAKLTDVDFSDVLAGWLADRTRSGAVAARACHVAAAAAGCAGRRADASVHPRELRQLRCAASSWPRSPRNCSTP